MIFPQHDFASAEAVKTGRNFVFNSGRFLCAFLFFIFPLSQAEAVTITSPADQSQFILPTNIEITVSNDFTQTSKVEFFDNAVLIGESILEPFNFSWTNAPVGFHTLIAQATDTNGIITVSAPISISITTTGGILSATLGASANTIDLSSEGVTDWVHWGRLTENSLDRKIGVTPLISDFQPLGASPVFQFDNNFTGYSWTNGTPTISATNTTTGIYAAGLGEGFEITLPANTNLQRLKLYLGAYGARGKLLAFLSDFTAPIFVDTNLVNLSDGPNGVYTLDFASASMDQELTIRFTVAEMYDIDFGNVTLQAATLNSGNAPPSVSVTAPTNNAVFNALTNITLTAAAEDNDGTVSRVEFFKGAISLGVKTNSPFSLTWSNVAAGNYVVIAKATDNLGAVATSIPINIFVTIPGGFLAEQVSTPPSLVDLTAEGKSDWIHWALLTRTNINRKINGASQISTNTQIGGTRGERYFDNPNSYTWSDGTPTTNIESTATGLYITGLGNGFSFTVPADTTLRRLKVYVGVFRSQGKLEATLSDFSAVSYIDSSLANSNNNASAVYTIHYAAASAGKKLTVKYTSLAVFNEADGNVTLQAAALANPAPVLKFLPIGNLSFSTEQNFNYTVQFTDSLDPVNWQTFSNFFGNGLEALLNVNPSDTAKRFYRVRMVP